MQSNINTVEIIVTGDEILNGDIVDSNSSFIIRKITEIGGYVTRVITIRDQVETIAEELNRSIANNPSVIITAGGLGPTPDDVTLQGISSALDRMPEINEKALNFITEKYLFLKRNKVIEDATITPPRMKMAMLPKGSVALENPVGTAPPVLTEASGSLIFSLPGVPSELKSIFENVLKPILVNKFGDTAYLEKVLILGSRDESKLFNVLKEMSENYGTLYFKSRAQSFENEIKLTIIVAGRGKPDEISKKINIAIDALAEKLNKIGIKIEKKNKN